MNAHFLPPILRRGILTVLISLVFVLPVHAGNIFFGLSLTGTTLTLTNQGNSTAFYPAVMRLLSDGRWEALPPAGGIVPSAELLPGAKIDLTLPNPSPQDKPFALDRLRPVMVRFFDQAGNYFGQISFFNQPPIAGDLSKTGYVNGLMTIAPPTGEGSAGIRSSWLLWAQEEGIAPLSGPVDFLHKQPPARHIEWRPGMSPLRLNFGAAMPSAILLHETGDAYMLQSLINGGRQGTQQRSAWLDDSQFFFKLADWTALAAALLMLWHLVGAWRERSTT